MASAGSGSSTTTSSANQQVQAAALASIAAAGFPAAMMPAFGALGKLAAKLPHHLAIVFDF